mmetsp:Transcript_6684/g.16701  ORF Transcript_6684/g.16701 Transcript_6684/m.16701 type:complete len:325 (-) Transcript_6684:418-1392(-)
MLSKASQTSCDRTLCPWPSCRWQGYLIATVMILARNCKSSDDYRLRAQARAGLSLEGRLPPRIVEPPTSCRAELSERRSASRKGPIGHGRRSREALCGPSGRHRQHRRLGTALSEWADGHYCCRGRGRTCFHQGGRQSERRRGRCFQFCDDLLLVEQGAGRGIGQSLLRLLPAHSRRGLEGHLDGVLCLCGVRRLDRGGHLRPVVPRGPLPIGAHRLLCVRIPHVLLLLLLIERVSQQRQGWRLRPACSEASQAQLASGASNTRWPTIVRAIERARQPSRRVPLQDASAASRRRVVNTKEDGAIRLYCRRVHIQDPLLELMTSQ